MSFRLCLLAITALAAVLFRLPGRIGKLERRTPPLSVGFFAFVSHLCGRPNPFFVREKDVVISIRVKRRIEVTEVY